MPPALHRTGARPRTKKGAPRSPPQQRPGTRAGPGMAHRFAARAARASSCPLVPAPQTHMHTHLTRAARPVRRARAPPRRPPRAGRPPPGPARPRSARALWRDFFCPAIRLLTTVKSHLPLRARPPPTAIHVGGAKTLDASARSASERCTVTSN